jgi:glycosyltransferase involved in cell wall biosynthesis
LKILFTSTEDTPFIREDLAILKKSHDVRALTTRGWSSIPRIMREMAGVSLTYTWFASVYSAAVVFLARRLGKKSILVVGGVDAARVPEFGYGIWNSPWKSVLVRYAMTHADKLIAITPFLRSQVTLLAGYDGGNIVVIPTGYDPGFWVPGSGEERSGVLTVAACEAMPRVRIKGLPFLLEVARAMPDVPFTIVGPREGAAEFLHSYGPSSNVTIVPHLHRDELLAYYQGAKVYCQPSYYEGGLAGTLCEAMLCECVPVGSSVGGIITAIGDAGYLAPYGDVPAFASSIRTALNSPAGAGRKAREHVRRNFLLSARESLLREAVEKVAA